MESIVFNTKTPLAFDQTEQLGHQEPEQSRFIVWLGENQISVVRGLNWLTALGTALADQDVEIGNFASEVLPNGKVIVTDLKNRRRYMVQQASPS